jgi:uroporphyrinogen decarboxylase
MIKFQIGDPSMRQPDFGNLLKVLKREKPARPTLFEFFLNDALYTELSGMKAGEGKGFERLIKAFQAAGYDYATVHAGFALKGFPKGEIEHEKSISLNDGALITDRESFAAYKWPDVDACDYSELKNAKNYLPDGMKLIVCGPGGVLENTIRLLGYDKLCFMLADDPELVKMICDNVGSRLLRHYELAGQYDTVGAMISNDDWGFRTQPMISPDSMRELILPWHKRIVAAIHAAGKPAILHSCGKLGSLMDDVIDDIGFDGKHSYEDNIEPVEEAYERLHSRIAVLGGIDLDFLCRKTPEEVKGRARRLLEQTESRGSYALGSGNSIPDYVPWENYFAMTSAALEY